MQVNMRSTVYVCIQVCVSVHSVSKYKMTDRWITAKSKKRKEKKSQAKGNNMHPLALIPIIPSFFFVLLHSCSPSHQPPSSPPSFSSSLFTSSAPLIFPCPRRGPRGNSPQALFSLPSRELTPHSLLCHRSCQETSHTYTRTHTSTSSSCLLLLSSSASRNQARFF